jgi:molybdate transport system substrate-binding protein
MTERPQCSIVQTVGCVGDGWGSTLRSTGRWARGLLLVALLGAFAGVACDSEDGDEIVVSAASSLTDAFTELAEAFEQEHGAAVSLNFGSSSSLAVQLVEGAPAHVFASANAAQMDVVVDAGLAQDAAVLARNEIVVVTPAGRGLIEGFEDLASDGVRLALAGPDVPVGAYAREAIDAANEALGGAFAGRVLANVVSEEANVRAVLTKVELGEVDAGIVYATDAAAAGDVVEAYRVPKEFAPPAEYFIATLADAPDAAQEFVEFVLSEDGQAILERHGFTPAGG